MCLIVIYFLVCCFSLFELLNGGLLCWLLLVACFVDTYGVVCFGLMFYVFVNSVGFMVCYG